MTKISAEKTGRTVGDTFILRAVCPCCGQNLPTFESGKDFAIRTVDELFKKHWNHK